VIRILEQSDADTLCFGHTHKRYETVRLAKLNHSAEQATAEASYNSSIRKMFAFIRDFIRERPGSPLSIIALQMMAKGDPTIGNEQERRQDLQSLFESLTPEVRESELGLAYRNLLEN
jgi:hypothetical protein